MLFSLVFEHLFLQTFEYQIISTTNIILQHFLFNFSISFGFHFSIKWFIVIVWCLDRIDMKINCRFLLRCSINLKFSSQRIYFLDCCFLLNEIHFDINSAQKRMFSLKFHFRIPSKLMKDVNSSFQDKIQCWLVYKFYRSYLACIQLLWIFLWTLNHPFVFLSNKNIKPYFTKFTELQVHISMPWQLVTGYKTR